MTAKKPAGDGKPKTPAKTKEPKVPTKAPESKAPPSMETTPREEIPAGKAKCQFCSHIQPLKRGDDSISRMQGTCEVTNNIVWMNFFCDKFHLKVQQP